MHFKLLVVADPEAEGRERVVPFWLLDLESEAVTV